MKDAIVGRESFESDLHLAEELFPKIANGYEPTQNERGWFRNVGKRPPKEFDHCQWLIEQATKYKSNANVLDFLSSMYGQYDPNRDEATTPYRHLRFDGYEQLRKIIHELHQQLKKSADVL